MIAQDAQLEEKSQALLIDFVQKLQSLSKASMQRFVDDEAANAKSNNDQNADLTNAWIAIAAAGSRIFKKTEKK
jgi:hypothetical protein